MGPHWGRASLTDVGARRRAGASPRVDPRRAVGGLAAACTLMGCGDGPSTPAPGPGAGAVVGTYALRAAVDYDSAALDCTPTGCRWTSLPAADAALGGILITGAAAPPTAPADARVLLPNAAADLTFRPCHFGLPACDAAGATGALRVGVPDPRRLAGLNLPVPSVGLPPDSVWAYLENAPNGAVLVLTGSFAGDSIAGRFTFSVSGGRERLRGTFVARRRP